MEIRDNRQKEWFWLDNEYLNGYARHLGVMCTSVYISLCRHSDNKTQTCFPSMELIATEIGAGRNAVSRAIKTLQEWGILSIEEQYDPKTKKRKNNIYTLLAKSHWREKPCTTKEHGLPMHSKSEKPCTFEDESHAPQECSNNTHINNTHITTLRSESELSQNIIPLVIKEFENVNKACTKFYNNKAQRTAVEDLVNAYGIEKVTNVIGMLPKLNSILFTKAITPVQLWNNWAKIEAEAIQLKNKKSTSKYAISTY